MMKLFVPFVFAIFAVTMGDPHGNADEAAPSLTSTAACSMPPDTADCGGDEQRWFFHSELKECRVFKHRGCGGSPNNFASKQECENICLDDSEGKYQKSSEPIETESEPEGSVEKKPEASEPTETEPDASESTPLKGDNIQTEEGEGTEEEEESEQDLEEVEKEQDELVQRFNMAGKDDMITLESLMQDPVMDIGQIVEQEEDSEDGEEGDIKGFLYRSVDDIASEGQEETSKSDEGELGESSEPGESWESADLEKGDAEAEEKDEPSENDKPLESDEPLENDETELDDDEAIYETEREQDALMKQFSMASKDDMIELENLLQNDNMDVGEVINNPQGRDSGDLSGFMYSDGYEDEGEIPQQSEQVSEAEETGDQSDAAGSVEPEEDEEIRETLSMERQVEQGFSMANKQDLLTLESILQDENMDISDIIDRKTVKTPQDGDIAGVIEINEGGEYPSETSQSELEEEQGVGDSEEEAINYEYRQHAVQNDQSRYTNGDRDERGETGEHQNDVDQTRELFGFADDKDYITAENLMSSGSMEEMEIVEDTGFAEGQDNSPVLHGTMIYERYESESLPFEQDNAKPVLSEEQYDVESVPSEVQYDVESEEQYAESVPSEEQYDVDSAPSEEQYMESVPSEEQYDVDSAPSEEQHMESVPSEEQYDVESAPTGPHNVDSADSPTEFDQGEKEDGGDIDDSYELTEEYRTGDEGDEQTLKMEEELEDRFGMADPQDLQTLEGLVQEPEMNLMELIPREKSGRHEEGDIEGVLSMAASFLGKEDQRDIKGIQDQLQQSMERVGERDTPVEFKDPNITPSENEIGVRPTTQPMISLEKASYKDKSMLMSMLHNDLLQVHKIRGSSLPKLTKDEFRRFEGKRPVAKSGFRYRKQGKNRGGRQPKCCTLPKDAGPCKGDLLQWHYDPFIGTCLPFKYGGCRGNRNRFDTIGACLRKCGGIREKKEKMIPKPIPEPPIVGSPDIRIKSIVSNFLPKKLLKSAEVLTPGQDQFMRMLSNAVKHVTEIKPIRISPVSARAFVESEDGKRPPIPLKSVMFKWPIIRMIFDKRAKSGKFLPPRLPPPEPKEAAPKPVLEERFPPRPDRFPPPRDSRFPMSRDNGFPKPRGAELRPQFDRQAQHEHFAPSFRKEFKVMSHHEDNSHRVTSDPKNKVNLIQVFVNKPHNEAKAEPQHHHTMIKKHQFSSGGDYHAVPPHRPPPFYPPHPYHPIPPFHPPRYPPPFMPHHDEHTHEHTHDDRHGNGYPHSHVHYHSYPHDHFHGRHQQPQQPWIPPYDRPHLDSNPPQSRNPAPPHFHSNIRPSTSYPEVADDEPEVIEQEVDGDEFEEGTDENVVVVTVPPGDEADEPNYACLLPLSTGVCKAFEEKFYYNIETRSCELFFYGGCGGNANNFNTREDCEATCTRSTPVPEDVAETTTLPDDTIYITSPVYVTDAPLEDEEDDVKAHEIPEVRKESKFEENVKDDTLSTDENSKSSDPEHIEVYAEPVSLFRSNQTEYIIIVVVMSFVGLSAAALVCLAVANLTRRLKTTKKEKVIEAVLASHLERSSSGSETPRMVYYGQPPAETGPPPITDVPKIHKEKIDQEL